MKKQVIKIIIVVFCLAWLSPYHAVAQDWPCFLGPTLNSTSTQKGLFKAWPEKGPEVLWTASVGIGYGGPVIKDDKVYLFDRDDKTGDNMRCFDLETGKELWSYANTSSGTFPFPGSRSVPAVDEKYVFGCGAIGDLVCIDIKTHQLVWSKNIWTDFGGTGLPIWAISQCPLLYGNHVIVSSHAPEAGVVAYDKLTGKVAWKTPNLGNETYVSPTVAKIAGNDHIVMVTSSTNPFRNRGGEKTMGKIIGIDPASGKVLWQYDNWDCHISVANVLDAGNNKLLLVGGYELGTVMVQVEKKADNSYNVKELFKHNEFGDQTKPPVMHNGYFYAQFGTNNKRDGLVCMDMEGKILWKTKRDPDFNKGSMILADGLILATDGSDMLYLIQPDPAGFKALASAKLLNQGGVDNTDRMTNFGGSTQNWAPLALSKGKLLIRDQSRMLCVKVAE